MKILKRFFYDVNEDLWKIFEKSFVKTLLKFWIKCLILKQCENFQNIFRNLFARKFWKISSWKNFMKCMGKFLKI